MAGSARHGTRQLVGAGNSRDRPGETGSISIESSSVSPWARGCYLMRSFGGKAGAAENACKALPARVRVSLPPLVHDDAQVMRGLTAIWRNNACRRCGSSWTNFSWTRGETRASHLPLKERILGSTPSGSTRGRCGFRSPAERKSDWNHIEPPGRVVPTTPRSCRHSDGLVM